MFYFLIFSPTVLEWMEILRLRRSELENPTPQMEKLLEAIREDVDSQFDEKQGEWRPLRPFTTAKKEAANSDMRILHETRAGQGLRLRDAYKKAGYVTSDGKLIYTYPKEKPYAVEHQEGRGTETARRDKTTKTKPRTTQRRGNWRQQKELDFWDSEFLRRIGE